MGQFDSTIRGTEGGPYPCPCCGYVTLPDRGGFALCPVCWWEDDGQDDQDADRVRGGPNNDLSLTQARANFQRFGAASERWRPRLRAPRPDEYPTSS
jgi:hypothetical protein